MTQLRPAVCSSLKMPCIFRLMTPTFIFLAQNFSWAWYPLGNLVGISNIILATWLKYSYLFLSHNLLLSYPQTLLSSLALPHLNEWQYSCQKLKRYHCGFFFFSLKSIPSKHSLVLQNLSSPNLPLLVFTATSLFQGIVSHMNCCSSFLTRLVLFLLLRSSQSSPRDHFKILNHVISLPKIFQWLPIPLEIKSVLLSMAWMALNNLSTSHCSSHLLYASHTALYCSLNFLRAFLF